MDFDKLKTNLLIIFVSILALITVATFLLFQIIKNENQFVELEEKRYRFYLLADELRQTSDDLTRMARLYVVTADPKYKQYFQTILDIRNGIHPRPKNYHGIYWDFYIATGQPPKTQEEPIAFQDMIQQEDFTQKELAFLSESENASNTLSQIEEKAMNIMSGIYQDAQGRYIIKAPDQAEARNLLHGDEYNQVKEKIMRPLDQFFDSIEERSVNDMDALRQKAKQLNMWLIVTMLIALGLLIVSCLLLFFALKKPQEVLSHQLSFFAFFRSHLFQHWPFMVAAIAVISLILGVTWQGLNQNKRLAYDNLNQHLNQSLQSAHSAVLDWINQTHLEILLLSEDISYHIPASVFEEIHEDKFEHFQSEVQKFRISHRKAFTKYIILNNRGVVAASYDPSLVGKPFEIPQTVQKQIQTSPYKSVYFTDNTSRSHLLSPDTVLFGISLKNQAGFVFILLNSEEILSDLLTRHFFGNRGEIYMINKNGQFISQSRWIKQLAQKGFVIDDSMAGLRVSQDPLNTKSSLIFSVQQVLRGDKGFELNSYPSYLKENVVGRWLWNNTYQFGLIAEWHKQEALAMFTNYKQQAFWGTVLTVLLILLLALFFIWKNVEVSRVNAQLTDAYSTIKKQNEKYSRDLEIGQKVQMDMLPHIIKGQGFAIDAILKPAQIVSGDFYDFAFVGPEKNKLYFSIGDVSGKGVPAALFMSVTKALLHKTLDQIHEPHTVIDKVNKELSQNNERCMFVTLIVGVMDIQTGLVHITNAGHNPPYLKKQTGEVLCLETSQGPLVGTFEKAAYSVQSVQLNKGDFLVFYTDGVTEAQNEQGTFYTETRMEAFLKENTFASPKKLTDGLSQSVTSFIGNSEPFDDVTILALSYLGKRGKA